MNRKTAAITAASIIGVIVAGSAAVGANIGILNAADANERAPLSAVATIVSPVDSTPSPNDVPNVQLFTVDAAGTVAVEASEAGLRLGEIHALPGWTGQESPGSADVVNVSFVSATDALEFVASLEPDGTITARVDRPTDNQNATSPSDPAAPTPRHDDDRYDDEDDDDHRDEDDDGHEDDDRDDDYDDEDDD